MFSIKESVKYGWQKAKEHMEVAFFATLLIVVVSSLSGANDTNELNVKLSIFEFILTIFSMIIHIGYTKIFLRIHDGESPKFSDIFREYKTFWRYLGVSILYMLTILGGLILLIIPGIFWAVRFSFAPIIVIDTKSGPVAAMKESYAITRGGFWKILLFWVAMAAFNLLGLIFFAIGLIITIPVSTLASVYVYRRLSAAKAGVAEVSSPQAV